MFKNVSNNPNILIFKSALVGLATGLLASLFHQLLDTSDRWRQTVYENIDGNLLMFLLVCLVSVAAVFLSLFLVRRFAPEASGSGIQYVELSLKKHKRIRWQQLLPVKFIGGLLAIGSGLVLGREGPTIHMGSSLGSMISHKEKQDTFQHHVLVAAGAAAGLAAAFNAPLAGLIFVTEEMRDQFKYNFYSLTAVTLSSVVAVIVVQLLSGRQPDITDAAFQSPSLATLPLFALLGIFFGIIGPLFNRLLLASLIFFKKQHGGTLYLFAALGAIAITVTGIFSPVMTGSGHNALELALANQLTIGFLLVVFVVRFAFSILSYSIGTPGGIFAPMLALGTFFGLCYGQVITLFFPGFIEHPGIFAVGGMGALFAATVQAPVTGIVLIVEMTRSYQLILPLMITCLTASLVANRMGGKPVYSQLAKQIE
jgi:CIC family chloride channel protein